MGLTVTQIAARVGLPDRTIRYYDRIGLVTAAERSSAGYRLYGVAEEDKLLFTRRAKALGFSLEEIRELLAAAEGGCGGTLPELGRLLDQKVTAIDAKIAEFVAFRARLVAYRSAKDLTARASCSHNAFCGCLDDVPEP